MFTLITFLCSSIKDFLKLEIRRDNYPDILKIHHLNIGIFSVGNVLNPVPVVCNATILFLSVVVESRYRWRRIRLQQSAQSGRVNSDCFLSIFTFVPLVCPIRGHGPTLCSVYWVQCSYVIISFRPFPNFCTLLQQWVI